VGTFLDAASMSLAVLDHESESSVDAALCVRAGSLAMRDIAEYFNIEVDHDPQPDDPISITREGFNAAYDELAAAGVPVKDREEAWVSWAGWRVNYDAALVGLARATASATTHLTEGGTYGALS
jgi:hypothetical protein